MKIFFLPPEFSEVFHFAGKSSFDTFARTVREAEKLIIRVQIEDFTEDDLFLNVADRVLIILGSRAPASFCLHINLPSDAVVKEAKAELKEGFLEITMPLQSPSSASTERRDG